MDPVSLEKLLTVADIIATQFASGTVKIHALEQILAANGSVKFPERRAKDILRVLRELGWLKPLGDKEFGVTSTFSAFLSSWDAGDLLGINTALLAYPPYARFLEALRAEKRIQLPKREDKVARRELGVRLKAAFDITFVAFDTFRSWATSVGQAYLSPWEATLYWGGDWDHQHPDMATFKTACWRSYLDAQKASGYANIADMADLVCRQLHISFQAFEQKIRLLITAEPGLLSLAPATTRPPRRLFQIATVRPRSEVVTERQARELLHPGQAGGRTRWLEYRYLEDGIKVNGHLVRLLSWRCTDDFTKGPGAIGR